MTPTERAPSAATEQDAANRLADPCVMAIFGASGDLTKRKLIPALYNLAKDHLLSPEFALVGVSKDEFTLDQYRDKVT